MRSVARHIDRPGPDRHVPPDAPDPDFLDKLTLGFASVLPAGTPARAAGRRPLPATGPYMIARYRPRHELRLARNPRFREWSQAAQPDGFPDAIAFRFNVKGKTAVTDVERGRADDFAGPKDAVPAQPGARARPATPAGPGRASSAASRRCSSTRVSRPSTMSASAER